jgi:hypothetical protein
MGDVLDAHGAGETVALTLISHTNAGKTTLARTLLGRDVGIVRDAQHVTDASTAYPLLESPQGDALVLWDTPGFGDSARLARRLAAQRHPVGWFLSSVWDRFRDRAFFMSQQALRTVAERTDVVLYLVSAAEPPARAGYLAAELDILAWMGKPAIVLVNQTGAPRPQDETAADEAAWREAIGERAIVRAVATLDAFTRCWVQEIALLDLVADALADAKHAAMVRLAAAWEARRLARFDAAMAILAAPLVVAATDREALPERDGEGLWRAIGRRLGIGDAQDAAQARASGAMRARLDDALRTATEGLLALEGLDGRAAADIDASVAAGVVRIAPMSEGRAALVGGALSGAVSGLATDLATGGLSFGAGLVAGALLGALGGAGVARGMNLARGAGAPALQWGEAFLDGLVAALLLRYLAIAHHGRGGGEWRERECPPFWSTLAADIAGARAADMARVWSLRGNAAERTRFERECARLMHDVAWQALERLYPGMLPVDTASADRPN